MFTELGGITQETGLAFDGVSRLYGSKRGYGTVVTDIEAEGSYRVEMFCDMGSARESEISALITELAESLPKNTLTAQSCEWGYVLAVLNKYSLLQENVEYLIEFLDKLADGLASLGVQGREYRLLGEDKPAAAEPAPKGAVRVKLGFDLRSILGILGALLGALAMVVVAVLTVNADFEINTLELRFEISTYILSGLTAAVVFADYRFIARKLDPCGVIVCPLFTVSAVILSGLGAGVRACARFAEVPFLQALRGFPGYLEAYESVGSFMFGYITRGLVLAVIACILIYIFYFSRHPDETERSERYSVPGEDFPIKLKKR